MNGSAKFEASPPLPEPGKILQSIAWTGFFGTALPRAILRRISEVDLNLTGQQAGVGEAVGSPCPGVDWLRTHGPIGTGTHLRNLGRWPSVTMGVVETRTQVRASAHYVCATHIRIGTVPVGFG